jgi:hypothetical protein
MTTRPTEMERALHEIMQKHFTNCLWQVRVGSKMLVECMNFSAGGTVAIVTQHFKDKLPKQNSGGNWPELGAYEIYVPADYTDTHVATDEALTALTVRRQEELAKQQRSA